MISSPPQKDSHLNIPADALVAFVDETGDPTYGNPGNPVFGLGGCAVLGHEIEGLIVVPWSKVRLIVGGSTTTQLHAAKVERRLTTRKEEAIRTYFNAVPIRRFAAISAVNTTYRNTDELGDQEVTATARSMLQRIADIARWMPFSSLIVIFEDNPHLIPRLQVALSDFEFMIDGTGVPRPLTWCHMPKLTGDSGLEVADFIIHSIAGYCRSGRHPQGKFAARFSSIFGTEDERLVSFMEISAVAGNVQS